MTGTGSVRRDPLTDREVLLVPGRATRPGAFRDAGTSPLPPFAVDCPFCPGNEHSTPAELARRGEGAAGTPGWSVRAFPNLYPVAGAPDDEHPRHEVLVFSPAHDGTLERLDQLAIAEVLTLARDRVGAQFDAGAASVQLLVNQGREAGASLEHPHAQIVGLDAVPPAVAAAGAAQADATVDPLAHVLTDEAEGPLAVGSAGDARAWCPRASVLPFHVRVAHPDATRFEHASEPVLTEVAGVLRHALVEVTAAAGPAYNVVLWTPPRSPRAPFRWFLDVIPRRTVLAGFELGTGLFVNIVEPESAAATLRGDDGER